MIIPAWVKPALIVVSYLVVALAVHHYDYVVYDRAKLQFQTEAQEKAKTYTKQLQGIANLVEKQSYENQKKHEAELAYYRNLVNQSGGLYDNGSTGGETTPSTGSNQASPSGARLSEVTNQPLSKEATEFLLNQANLADRVVDQFLQCQQYVNSIGEIK